MPFREKISWLYLFAMAITFGPYFTLAALNPPVEALPNFHQLSTYAVAALSQMVILGIGYLILRHIAPDDASVPPDERDRAIAHRAMSCAYYVLLAGMMVVGCVMPFFAGGWSIVNSALFMIALSQVVHNVLVVISYRRQV